MVVCTMSPVAWIGGGGKVKLLHPQMSTTSSASAFAPWFFFFQLICEMRYRVMRVVNVTYSTVSPGPE